MGMSGLARGRAPWVMKSAFLCRGGSALLLLIALPGCARHGRHHAAGLVAFWIWGVGSAALAVIDTDMPGEPPSRAGAAHAPWRWWPTSRAWPARSCCRWCCSAARHQQPGHLGAGARADGGGLHGGAVRGVRAAAREARGARRARPPGRGRAGPRGSGRRGHASRGGAAAVPPPLAGVPPQLAGGPAGDGPGVPRRRLRRRLVVSLADLAGYAGLLQRIFVGLLMAWTLLVALGIG